MHALQQQYSNFVSVRQLLSSKFIIYVERIEKKRFFPICEFFFIEKSSDLCLNIFIESSKLLCEISRIFFSVPKKSEHTACTKRFYFYTILSFEIENKNAACNQSREKTHFLFASIYNFVYKYLFYSVEYFVLWWWWRTLMIYNFFL